MMRVSVSYFALFKEQVGCDQEQVDTQARTAQELFVQMQQVHPGLQTFDAMKFAVNDELVGADAQLCDGDRVLFFPPVAGG